MTLQTVLWPTDFSERASQALNYIKHLTRKFEAEIHILHVMEVAFEHPEQYGDFDAEHIDKLLAWAKWKASQRLDTICDEHLEGCPYYVRHVAIGDPAEEILSFVHREKVDMIVMPTRGAKADAPAGSVAEKVVKQAPVPVVTIPPGMETAPAA